mgnify:CR=1 FL=1
MSEPLTHEEQQTCLKLARQALERGVRLSMGPVSLEDISRDLGLAAPTVYRFLLTLQGQGYVRRDHDDELVPELEPLVAAHPLRGVCGEDRPIPAPAIHQELGRRIRHRLLQVPLQSPLR